MTATPDAPPTNPFPGLLDDEPRVRWYHRLRSSGWRTTAAVVLTIAGLGGLTVAQVVVVAPTIEAELAQRSREALADAGIVSLTVRVDGRDVVLSGPVKDGRQSFAAEHLVAEVDGVRYVDASGVVVDPVTAASTVADPGTAAPPNGLPPAAAPSPTSPSRATTAPPTGADSTRTTITVVADKGRAVLAGAFPDPESARTITSALERTYGPGDVDVLAPTSATVTDTGGAEVAKTVAALGADAVGVTVSLDRGRITVAARVADAATKTAALAAAARAVPTTDAVVDKITVGEVDVADTATVDAQLDSLPELTFGAEQTTPGPVGRSVLGAMAFVLTAHPKATVTLIGHTDDTGDAATDAETSRARARAAERYLRTLGIRTSRVSTTGVGAEEPALPGTTEQARAANRRLVVRAGS